MPTSGVPSEGSTFPATAKIPTAASTLVPGTTEESTLATETSLGTTLSTETTSSKSLTEQTTVGVPKTRPTSGVPSEGSTFPTTASIPTATSTFVPRTIDDTTLGTETTYDPTFSIETTSPRSLTEQTTVEVPETRPTSGVPSERSTFPTAASIPTAASTFVPRTIDDTTLGTETTYGPTFSIKTTSPSSLTEQTTVGVSQTMPTTGVPSEDSTFPATAEIPTAASTLLPGTTDETSLATETSLGTTHYIETTSSKSLTEQTTVGVSQTMPTTGIPSEGSTFPATAKIPTAASTLVPGYTDETSLATETSLGTTLYIETTSPSSLTEQTTVEVSKTRPTSGVPSEGSTFPTTARTPTYASTLQPRTTEETTFATETTFGTTLYIETTSPSSLAEQTTVRVSQTMPTSGVPSEGSTFPTTARIPTAASTLVPRTTEDTTLGMETFFGTSLYTETTSPKSLAEQTTVRVPQTMPTSGVPSEGSTFPTTARIPTAASTLVPRTTDETSLATETSLGTTLYIETTSPGSLVEQITVGVSKTMPTSGLSSGGSTLPTTARIPTAASTFVPRTIDDTTLGTETTYGPTFSIKTTSPSSLTEQTTVGVSQTMPTTGVPSEDSTFPATAEIPTAASTLLPGTTDETSLATETSLGTTHYIETTSSKSLTEQTTNRQQLKSLRPGQQVEFLQNALLSQRLPVSLLLHQLLYQELLMTLL
ncbi:mucin-22-like [Drosophila tropicalis]|uniref:mucin-22-like n=1 Tax=Drosophila tropicalis TaxID=46794 RepID=UPI0035AB75AC